MTYIILDLEWNQPISYQSRTYREVGDKLIFEMIQIGAVRLDADLNPADSISIPIAPTHYLRIHPRIRRMTGLDSETLAGAPAFREALEQFVAWCGEDYTLLTWGCDDVSVLQQNLDFFDCHPDLHPLCDIQHQFSDEKKLANRMGLQAAMELLELQPEEDRDFHNAVNDAYYTALVFRHMPHPENAGNYARQPKQLIHPEAEGRIRTKGEVYPTIAAGLESEAISAPLCPLCGRPTKLEEGGYVPQAPDKYIGLARCAAHGPLMTRLTFRILNTEQRWMSAATVKATAQNIAYVHTKQLQVAGQRRRIDPEKALENAGGSSVPFAD
jgi:inhibitor of KinA sporulation pathway (predicted exonuclease)